jgi:hypothetical protein
MTAPVLTETPLPNYGYEIDGFRFGRNTPYKIKTVDFGELTPQTNDINNPRSDGQRFGRDYYRGRLITFDGNIYTTREAPKDQTAAPNALEYLTNAWTLDDVRLTPGKITSLRMHRNGRIRRVFGRPNRFKPSNQGTDSRGWIPFSCDFRCVDHLFYDDAEFAETIPLIPISIGGLVGPLIGPIIASDPSEGSGNITVKGTKPSWLIAIIRGPIVDPIIEVLTGPGGPSWRIELKLTLYSDQFVIIDPTPWNRSVRRNDGANMSGAFTAQSARLSQMRMNPGYNQVLLRGTDPTGTASMDAFWRDTYSSF